MTAIGWPFDEWAALTSSQLDACGGPARASRSSLDPIEPSLGISCGSGVSVVCGSPLPWSVAALVAVAAGTDTPGSPSLTKLTDPGSGTPSPPGATGEPISYGKFLLETVTGASGSLCSRKLAHAWRPWLLPNC